MSVAGRGCIGGYRVGHALSVGGVDSGGRTARNPVVPRRLSV